MPRTWPCIVALITALGAAAESTAAVKVELFLSPAPNAFGSPSFDPWFANAQQFALGLAPAPVGAGNPAFRGDYAGTVRPCHEFLVTSFDSFDGVLGGTGEFGQRMHAVYHIYDDAGGTVELQYIRGLALEASYDFAPDPGAAIGPIDFDSSRTFDPARRVGYNDSDLSTPITSGNDPVNHIVGTFGQAYWPGGDAPDPATDPSGPPAYLTCFADFPNDIGGGHTSFTYFLGYDDGGTLTSTSATVVNSNTTLSLSIPDVTAPLDPVKVCIDVTTNKTLLTAVRARLAFDASKYDFLDVVTRPGSIVPSSWDTISADASTPGEVAFEFGDDAPSPDTVDGPLAGEETVCVRLQPRPSSCGMTPNPFDLASVPQLISFVEIGSGTVHDDESWRNEGASGPVVASDHGLRRGNVSTAGAFKFELNIQDVTDLAHMLFAALARPDCLAVMDVNNDGKLNISDLVTLVQGVFNGGVVRIPPPNAPFGQSVAPDGGDIPSELGCDTGQGCP